MRELIDRLYAGELLSKEALLALLQIEGDDQAYLFEKAREVAKKHFGNGIYTRGLIELTNYCKNDCYYCGIRRSNHKIERYRLTEEEVLVCCDIGYTLGFRTFVLQGGEDNFYKDEKLEKMIRAIKTKYPECAITLSLGEKSYESYERFFKAGADRYLLRHETANEEHYSKLHPDKMQLSERKKCLYNLKAIGYQVGTGFLIGSPYQTLENLVEDLLFTRELRPQMVGIGPFLSHKDTPFAMYPNGSKALTLRLIAILRLMLPKALLPATTALGTIEAGGREEGILAGANVVMPNLSPLQVRKKYMLYDNKISTGEEAAESRQALQKRMEAIGYTLLEERGDYKNEGER